LLPAAALQAEQILSQYDHALEKEAEEKIRQNQRHLAEVEQKIGVFNEAVEGINGCLEMMQLDRHRLPTLNQADLLLVNAGSNDVKNAPVYDAELVMTGDNN
jgi:hypothetical protein